MSDFELKFSVDYGEKVEALLSILSKKEDFLLKSCAVREMVLKAEKSFEYAKRFGEWLDKKISTIELRDELIKPLYDLDEIENFNIFLSLDSAQLKL